MPFGPDELGPTEGSELDDSLEAIRSLETVAADANVRMGTAFSDRVMAALANEPSPAPAGFLLPLQRRGLLAGFGQSVRQAWASIGTGRPAFARAAALAYVLVVALAGTSLAGAATFGAAGALGLLEPHESVVPSPEATPAPLTTPPAPLTTRPSFEPTESPEPSETAEPSDDHGGGVEPSDDHSGSGGGGGAEPSDDHSGSGSDGGSGGGGSDDGSSGSGGGSGPSATDEHGGSDDGSGGGSGSGSGSDSGGGTGADD